MKPGIRLATLLTGLMFTAGFAVAADAPPQVTTDGLHLVEGSAMARVYAKPGADLSQYRRIYLVRPMVAFTKGWQQNQNRIPNRTMYLGNTPERIWILYMFLWPGLHFTTCENISEVFGGICLTFVWTNTLDIFRKRFQQSIEGIK